MGKYKIMHYEENVVAMYTKEQMVSNYLYDNPDFVGEPKAKICLWAKRCPDDRECLDCALYDDNTEVTYEEAYEYWSNTQE